MPARLPAASGYTYAAEFSIQEAQAESGERVDFREADGVTPKDVFTYLVDFLGFSAGDAVPSGYYDRLAGHWIASDNGRVVQITDIVDDKAVLAGAGGLAITDPELEQLADLFSIGTLLWRIPVSHFSAYDYNWPYGPPTGAVPPSTVPPNPDPKLDCPPKKPGSIIECEGRILGEQVDLPTTPFTLIYNSGRVPGRKASYELPVQLIGDVVPPDLVRIDLILQVAGQRITREYTNLFPFKTDTIPWDGRDRVDPNRVLQGSQSALVEICYVYEAQYYSVPSDFEQAFAAAIGSNPNYQGLPSVINGREDTEISLCRSWQTWLGTWDARAQGFGGWTLDVLHAYDPNSKTLYLGNGNRRSAESVGWVIETVAGKAEDCGGGTGDGGPATDACLIDPWDVAVAPDGTLYISEKGGFGSIRKVATNGTISTLQDSNENDLIFSEPRGLALTRDGDLLVAEYSGGRVSRVHQELDGSYSTGLVLNNLDFPIDVAVGPDGNIYVAESVGALVHGLRPQGPWLNWAGHQGVPGDNCSVTYDQQAASVPLRSMESLAAGPDGSVFIADPLDKHVHAVGVDGVLRKMAGYGRDVGILCPQDWQDPDLGGLAIESRMHNLGGLAIDLDGSLLIGTKKGNGDFHHGRLYRLRSNGTLQRIAGDDEDLEADGYGNGWAAVSADLADVRGVTVAPDGSIYLVDSGTSDHYLVRRIKKGVLDWSSTGDHYIPSADGRQVYVFAGGRHARTLDAQTESVLWSFVYDQDGYVVGITGADGRMTTIDRSISDYITITPSGGATTTLALDTIGYLDFVQSPGGRITTTVHDSTPGREGLLTSFTDARNSTYTFEYDDKGRLATDTTPQTGNHQHLTSVESPTQRSIETTHTSGEGLVTTYLTEWGDDGSISRVVTAPDGTVTNSIGQAGSGSTMSLPNGLQQSISLMPDDRWGMQVPIVSATVTDGGERSASIQTTRTATFPSDDLFPLTSQVETTAFYDGDLESGGHIYWMAAEYLRNGGTNEDPPTYTRSSPLSGRRVEAVLYNHGTAEDPRWLVEQVEVPSVPGLGPGLTPLSIDWTFSGGELSHVTYTQGDRVSSVLLDDQGRVQAFEGPDGRRQVLVYDARGFVVSQELWSKVGEAWQHQAEVDFGYDANGNLASITRPHTDEQVQTVWHCLGADVLDRLSCYDAPPLAGGEASCEALVCDGDADELQLTHDMDNRLTAVDFPGDKGIQVEYEAGTGHLESVQLLEGGVPEATIVPTYDEIGRVTQLTRDDVSLCLSYGGDPQCPSAEGEGEGEPQPLLTAVLWSSTDLGQHELEIGYPATSLLPDSLRVDDATGIQRELDDDGLLAGIALDTDGDGQYDDETLTIERDHAAGLVTGTTLGAVTAETTYSEFGEVKKYTAKFNGTIFYEYEIGDEGLNDPGRDKAGRITRRKETARPCAGGNPALTT